MENILNENPFLSESSDDLSEVAQMEVPVGMDAAPEGRVADDGAGPLSITTLTASGAQNRVDGLHGGQSLASLRSRLALQAGCPASLIHVCLGTTMLKAADAARTLEELGIDDGATLTVVRASGTALGQGRYALTSRMMKCGEDMLDAVYAEYGEGAKIADFAAIVTRSPMEIWRFLNAIGLHGGAFVLYRGEKALYDDSESHFFALRHSGNIPRSWLVADRRIPRMPETWEVLGFGRLDLCWRRGGSVMPVLVDLGPA